MKKKDALLEKLDQSLEATAAVPETAPAPALLPKTELRSQADGLIYHAIPWVVGAGLLPFPLVDLAAVVGLQIKLVRDLAHLYGVPFSEHQVKSILAALVGGGASKAISSGSIGTGLRLIPVVGPVLGLATFPLASAAATLAIGRLFAAHFEKRGTLLHVDLAKFKAGFTDEFSAARRHLKQSATGLVQEFKVRS